MKRACLLVIFLAASLGLAQAPPAQKKPLDQIQVLALLAGGVPSERVAMLVNERVAQSLRLSNSAACMLENGYMFLKYVLSQGLGELAAGNDSRNEPQSNALLRTTLRYPLCGGPAERGRPRQFGVETARRTVSTVPARAP